MRRLFGVIAIFVLFASVRASGADTLCLTEGAQVTAESDAVVAVLATTTFPVEAIQFAVCNDEGQLIARRADTFGTDIQLLNGGLGPEFMEKNVEDGHVTFGMLVNFPMPAPESLPPGNRTLLIITYGMAGGAEPGVTQLTFCGDVLLPAFGDDRGNEVFPETCTVDVSVGAIEPPVGTPFVRGELNAGAGLTISDMRWVLERIFRGRVRVNCDKAHDVNGDNRVDIADVIFLGNFIFRNGKPIPGPYPECGPDVTGDDTLTCEEYNACVPP